jgi:hypothetical protein
VNPRLQANAALADLCKYRSGIGTSGGVCHSIGDPTVKANRKLIDTAYEFAGGTKDYWLDILKTIRNAYVTHSKRTPRMSLRK